MPNDHVSVMLNNKKRLRLTSYLFHSIIFKYGTSTLKKQYILTKLWKENGFEWKLEEQKAKQTL